VLPRALSDEGEIRVGKTAPRVVVRAYLGLPYNPLQTFSGRVSIHNSLPVCALVFIRVAGLQLGHRIWPRRLRVCLHRGWDGSAMSSPPVPTR
jgi:hypothetical protein